MFRPSGKSSPKALALSACLVVAAIALGGCSSREQRAESYYKRGMSYIEQKDFVKARIELRNALQINGNMLAAWQALAQMDEKDRNWQALAGDLRKVVELDPKDANSKLRFGRLLLMGGAFDQALKMANEAGEEAPQNVQVLALKAAVLFKLKDADGAVSTAQKALEIEPGNVEASVVLAAAKYMQGDPQGALKVIDEIKPDSKDDLGVMFLEINIFDRLGEMDQVEKLLRKLVDLYPKEPAFRAQLIRFYVAHKRNDDAEKELRAVVAANPTDAGAELNLVMLLGQIKGTAAAREELVKRIAAGGDVFPYQLALTKIDFAQGHFEDSEKLLKTLITDAKTPENTLAAKITLAEMYMNRNNVAEAEPLITSILQTDSRNINGLALRASLHINRGQNDDAIADLRTALNDQPNSPELLANLGIAYERNGSIELADKAFADATKASHYSPAIGLNYASFLRRRGLGTQADNVVADLASRNPKNIQLLSMLAQIKLAHQDWDSAHAIADTIHKLGDKTDVADQISGAAFTGQKKFNDSLAVLQNAYDANPGAARPMAALVGAYIEAKQTDKAEAFLKSALQANPQNAEALVLMGSLELTRNKPDEAVKNFQAAIKEQPKNAIGYRALSDLYVRQKKIDEAISVVRQGLEQAPQNFTLELASAGLQEIKGDYEAAISEYEAMLKQQPGSMVVANNLASLLADHRTDKASLDRANALALLLTKSQVPQFKDTLGWVAYRRDDYNAAIPLLEDAGTALPNNALVRYHLGMSYLATGQDAKASEQFKKARELAPNDPTLKLKIDAADKTISDKSKG
jgi:tetratricopeptide (TPR) repeat protein